MLDEIENDEEDFVPDDDEIEESEEAIANVRSPRLKDRRLHALSPDDRQVCSHVATKGTDYLRYEMQWSAMQIKQFMARVAVQAELDYLRRAYAQREGIQERMQFFSQLQINRMVPRALQTLALTLRGDQLNDDGTVARAPSRAQYDAAVEVLERANVRGDKYKGEDSIPLIDARSIQLTLGENDDENSIDPKKKRSIDRVRNFMDSFIDRAKKVEANVIEGKTKKKKRRKKRRVIESGD